MRAKNTIIITGGNSGLGFECVKEIHRSPEWFIVIASRNLGKSNEAINQLAEEKKNRKIIAEQLDLASTESIRQFVERLRGNQDIPPIKAIICNSGVQHIKGTQYTKDGFEMTFGVNHLGHYLLVHLLSKEIVSGGRIIFVSSGTHDPARKTLMPPPEYSSAKELANPTGKNIEDENRLGMVRYSTSKLCNVMSAYEFSRQFKKFEKEKRVLVNAFDPGLMPGTGLANDYNPIRKIVWNYILPLFIPFIENANSAQKSGKALARLVLDPQLEDVTGKYFRGMEEFPSSEESYDFEKAKELWETSAELVNLGDEETIFSF